MTLPISPNSISIDNINTELGASPGTFRTLSVLNGLIKAAQRPSSPNFDAFRGKAYYQKTNDGNCTVNCPSNCNCGNIDSGANCIVTGTVNCVNCDAQAWLQTNCNCGPASYNCTYATYSYDCDCDCVCACSS